MTRDHAQQHTPAKDDYAHARCTCNHLLYADQTPGDPCRWCPCADHRPAAAEGGERDA